MADEIDITKIKQQRRLLLSNLDLFYPSPVRVETHYRTVIAIDPKYEFAAYRKDVCYFRDKGYIIFLDDELGGADAFEKKVMKLTALGLDIAQSIKTDPALKI